MRAGFDCERSGFFKENGINTQVRNGQSITAADCVVIEDSKEDIRAGMKCLAVTNSHPAELLT